MKAQVYLRCVAVALCWLASTEVYGSAQSLRHGVPNANVRVVVGAPSVSLAVDVTDTAWSLAVSARLPRDHFAAWAGRRVSLSSARGPRFWQAGVAVGAFASGVQVGGGLALDAWIASGWHWSNNSLICAISAPVAVAAGQISGLSARVPIQAEISWQAALSSATSIGVLLAAGPVWSPGLGVSVDGNVGVVLSLNP
ncbi:MAG: hypothetical protein CMH53_10855 [Myxococcales bacterium]|nr:hypothetical protein [Myxococcales bacterium]